MMVMLSREDMMQFDVALVLGVFIGAFIAALWGRELKLQGFESVGTLRRSMIGEAFMGFGGMLAGGCAIDAGVTAGSILAATALLALASMWASAMAADLMIDQGRVAALA
jgi:uncharacterized membrane protein YedE/YeeE